jgi:hypothetical protein
VSNVIDREVTFRITNADAIPFLSTLSEEAQMVYSYNGNYWFRFTTHSYSSGIYSFSEEFTNNEVFVATFFPFSYTEMQNYAEAVSSSEWVDKSVLGSSEQGRDLILLTITNLTIPVTDKKVIYIIGRQHAAETSSSHMIKGMIDFLISADPDAETMRNNYVWYIVPMVNPDGVYLGNSRGTADLRNANRDWLNDETQEITILRSHIDSIDSSYGIDFFIDWHSQMGDVSWYNFIYSPPGNTFFSVLSEWTDFDTQVSSVPGTGSPSSCTARQYISHNILYDPMFVFEPTPHLHTWTIASLEQTGMNVAYAIDEYFTLQPFTIIVLPDTQFYSQTYPAIFANQTQWIVNNVEDMNVLFVLHEGDIVDNDVPAQWTNANTSMSLLDGHVPWAVLPGNHDGTDVGGPSEDLTNYNTYFPYSRFSDETWYGDAYNSINTNSYMLFSAGYDDYIIFNFQYHPSDAVLAWANMTIEAYPDRRAIVVTHSYLDTDGERTAEGDDIWDGFVSHHADQVFLVLCGHMHGEAKRQDTVDGNVVYQVLADYQTRANGGDGWLRILEFHPEEDTIYVNTFSPYHNIWETDSDSQFTLAYDMSERVTLTSADPDLTSPSGDYRWMDVADQTYSSSYRDSYNYTQANVYVSFSTVGGSLAGKLVAQNLKPNFAYQLKLVGTPGTADNERIGLAGRWWEQNWAGSEWDEGWNLNNKGGGSSPNPNDIIYYERRDIEDSSSPTGYHHRYTGYLVFAYFITDSNGDAEIYFETGSCYHVLWKTDQRARVADDGPLETTTFDADPAQDAYDVDYPSQMISIFGEWERLPMGSVNLAAGSYDCQIVLTEESVHGTGSLEGNWAAAMSANISFTIVS